MASQVDATFPADNVQVDKASFRAQMLIIKTEITELQNKTGLVRQIAYGQVPMLNANS